MGNALRFKQTNIGRQKGELARFKVIQGPDYGAVYVVLAARATIGRGEENDIVISDLKASRVHAVISIAANGPTKGWIIKDIGSANGILHNSRALREASLKIGDTVTLGETTLEFITSDVGTQMLVAPPKTVEQLQSKIKSFGLDGISAIGSIGQNTKSKNNRLLIIVGIVLGVCFLLFSGDQKPRSPPKKSSSQQDLASYLPPVENNKTAEMIFKDGFREYLNGNYSRARTQFETVLQIVPGHPLATLYLQNCAKAVEDSVKHHLEGGKKAFDAGKLREARAHFERILRLLYRDQSSPAYIEAKDQNEKLLKVLKSTSEGGS